MSAPKVVDENGSDGKIAAALQMVQWGFRVFPLRDSGDFKNRKKPLREGWQQSATSDPAIIKQIWTERPECGVGALADGFVILDFDPKGGELHELRARAEDKFGKLPETLTFKTGGGGEHVVFRAPPGTEPRSIKNAVGLLPGIDNRSDGGYIVAPGNRLDPKMARYRVLHDAPIAVAPTSIVAALRRNAMRVIDGTDMENIDTDMAVRAATYVARGLPDASEGERNDKLHEYAHMMREYGVSPGKAFDILNEHWNLERVHPPLDAHEMRRTITSVYSKTVQSSPTGYMLDAILSAAEMAREAQMAGPPKEDTAPTGLKLTQHLTLDLTAMEPRDWVVENVAAKGYVTAVFGYAGVSKSTWTLHLALAIAGNRPNMVQMPDAQPPRLKQGTVLVYNGEDDTAEMRRRIAAEVVANEVPLDALSRVYTASGADEGAEPLILAKAKGEVAEVNEKGVALLIATAKSVGADVIVLDPIAELHNVVENSNDQSKVVGAVLRRVAKETGAAVIFAAHSRKPDGTRANDADAGNLHDLRGAGAMAGVIRLAFTVTGMTDREATDNRVPATDRHRYVRLTIAKNNLGPTNKAACWYKRIGVSMGPIGEEFEVGALVPWTFTRVEEDRPPLWEVIEKTMLDFPDQFEVGKSYAPTTVLRSFSEEDREVWGPGSIAPAMEQWFTSGPVKRGVEFNVVAERIPFGAKWRYKVALVERDPDDVETDYLA